MTLEGKVKQKIKAILAQFSNVWYFMPVSSGYGVHGIPDFIVCVHGKFLGIEAKAGNGKLTDLQRACHAKISDATGVVLTINETNLEMVNGYLDMMGAVPRAAIA